MGDAAAPAVETRALATSITISETDVCLRTASLNAFKEETKAGPRKVYMRFRIFDVKQIDAVAGTAFVDFGLYLRWFDPSLINISKKHFGRTVREYESLWSPKVEINNAVEMKELWDGDTSWNLKSYETGEMKYSQRYSGTIANQMDLRLFPFDADLVEIKLGPRVYKAGKVVFEHDAEFPIDAMEIKSPSLIDWDLYTPATFMVVQADAGHCNAVLSLHVARRYAYYMWKIIAVNYGAATFSWVAFLMPAAMIEERLNLTVTLFLAEVAFCFILSGELPKVPYLTLIDAIILGSFVMLFLIGLQSAVAYVLSQQADATRWFAQGNASMTESVAATVETFDMWCLLLFSISFSAWNLLHVMRGFWNRRRVQRRAEAARGPSREAVDAGAAKVTRLATQTLTVSQVSGSI